MKGQAVLWTAVGIGLTLLCLLGIAWLGPSGAFLNLLTPLAAAYLSMRYGLRQGIVVVVVTSVLLLQLTTTYTLIAYLCLFGIGSLLLPYCLRQRLPWDRSALYASLGAAMLTVMLVSAVLLVTGSNLPGLIDQVIQVEVEQAMQVYQDAGFADDQLQEMQKITEALAGFIDKSFYGLYLAALLVVQALTLVLLYGLKGKHYQLSGPVFAQWRLPAALIWVLIAAGFALLAPLEPLALLGRNVLVVLLPLYFFQGMAVVNNYLQQKPYPPLVKGVIYVLLLILNPLPIIVTSVGIFDLWIDFRRPRNSHG